MKRPLEGSRVLIVDRLWRDRLGGMLGRSRPMAELYDDVEKAAGLDGHVLVLGERGTGKCLIAGQIHGLGPRSSRPFVTTRCGEVPRVLEPRLFGYHSGFHGATACSAGLMEEVRGGTLLLKELDLMPAATQMKLLSMLQEGILRRLGGESGCPADLRLVGTTRVTERSSLQSIRPELYYRMSGAVLRIPALRDRREDIPVLVNSVLERTCDRLGKPAHRVSSKTMEELMAHDWPGNLTEMECVLEESLAVATHREIRPGNLRQFLWKRSSEDTRETVRHVLHSHIEEVLKRSGGNVKKAAAALGMPRSSLYRKLKDLK